MTAVPNRKTRRPRSSLSRDRILAAALDLADRIGVDALTIRRLAVEIDVAPMTIYHYLASKETIIDGLVDVVFDEIGVPPPDLEWRDALRVRCRSARAVLARHPWATPLLETRRAPGHATLRHHDAVLGCLRRGGLSLEQTAHAYAILDAYVYGFALQEAGLPFHGEQEIGGLASAMIEPFAEQFPHLAEFAVEYVQVPGYAFGHSFEIGLEIVIAGFDALSCDDR